MLWGLLAVLIFSLTLPATRIAVPEFGAVMFGMGRVLIAAALAAVVVLVRRAPLPDRRHWPAFAVVVLCVPIGFPLLTSFAMKSLPASHGSIVVGLIPLATAAWSTVLHGERPSRLFWVGCIVGVLSVLGFAIAEGAGRPQPADALLFAAAVIVGLGYTFGAKLSQEMAAWRVHCWAMLFAALPAALICLAGDSVSLTQTSPSGWFAMAWVGCGSMFCGFLAWYRGLALGGMARVGQMQLLMPLLSLVWSWLLVGETINATAWLAAFGILAAVGVCLRSR